MSLDYRSPQVLRRLGPPLPSPSWATKTRSDDDGIEHELVSPVCPVVRWKDACGWMECPSNVSLSVIDVPDGNGWKRLPVTVDLEGGSYTLDGARQMRDVLTEFLDIAKNSQLH
ncbi:MAG: hypothetical protein QG608_3759 [Actinomycetota bacterium]|nr:hypothetical protein [Actinomycetota bacterium]